MGLEYHQVGEQQMSLQQMGRVGDLMIDAIERHGSRIAFEYAGTQISYSQLAQDVARTIAFFQDNGLQPGDRIAQISANSYEVFVIIAAAYVGGYASLALQYNADYADHIFAVDDIKPAML